MKAINVLGLLVLLGMSSCFDEDPGPRQQDKRNYSVLDFDRIEAGDALIVTIQFAEGFSIEAEGDRRNLDDLMIYKNGNTLVAEFRQHERRQYETFLTITMPALYSADFSGATQATILGFDPVDRFDISLSGASFVQLNQDAKEIHMNLTGASQLGLKGTGEVLDGTISGASLLSAFEYPSARAKLVVSGASNSKVTVADELNVNVSGASTVLYRGEPELIIDSSGSSIVRKD